MNLSSRRVQGRLLILAALVLLLYSLALSLSPAVRARSWAVDYRWDHWLGMLIWLAGASLARRQVERWLPESDPYLLPIIALLTGWGMLSIWRLLPLFGLRQALWVGVAFAVLIAGLRLPSDLGFLRRYKYLWLTGSLALTAATLLLGVNPLGYGPRMWLGCCGVYLQPSEPLKLLLIAYLAAYMADRQPFLTLSADRRAKFRFPWLPLLAPTLVMTGLALTLLVVQRDLGTATVFLFIYAIVIYVTSGRKEVLALLLLAVLAAGVLGYGLFDVVRVRVDAWLNPWADPSGRSYQIVQALIAEANGGFFGRGPGIGSPDVVPVIHSDLIYTAIVEEQGLLGGVGLLLLLALLAGRGLRAALHAPDAYRRYLAIGLVAYLAGQSILIIGGSLRLLPLTGITLPFVSYGGSSLLTSFIALLILLHISQRGDARPAELPRPAPYLELGAFLLAGFAAAALVTGWWTIVRAPGLVARTDNPRRAIDDLYVRRGAILDRYGATIDISEGEVGVYRRYYRYPNLSSVVGYIDPVYGQSGLEASQDDYLRGERGVPGWEVAWSRLLSGLPLPGLDLRLSLDLELQRQVDSALAGQAGAAVLLGAESGEILAMSSLPTFDANRLADEWDALIRSPQAPLVNRAAQGLYPAHGLHPLAAYNLGMLNTPEIGLPVAAPILDEPPLRISPLQAALVAAGVSAGGVQPIAHLILAVNTPQAGWTPLSPSGAPHQVMEAAAARDISLALAQDDLGIWQQVLVVQGEKHPVTWYIGGSLPGANAPLALALVLEVDDPALAEQIGQAILLDAMTP